MLSQVVPELVTIYALSHPAQPEKVVYVGKTKRPLKKRLDNHLDDARKNPSLLKNKWINEVSLTGSKPLIWPLEYCVECEWKDVEKQWISVFKPHGIMNLRRGGESGPVRSGWKHTEESLVKIRKAVSESQERRKETCRKRGVRSSFLGRHHTPEAKEKQRQQRLGVVPWWATEKAAESNRGKHRPKWLVEHLREVNLKRTKPRPVVCVETGEKFRTYRDAALFARCAQSQIGYSVKRGDACRGFHFKSCEWMEESVCKQ